ncbi:MAG: LemA family protein [Bacteroidales bacterium]|nr:LemA family protein [Bacteroidales bacterium]
MRKLITILNLVISYAACFAQAVDYNGTATSNNDSFFWLIMIIICILPVVYYNSFSTAEENVKSAWSQVEIQYQRRADLISNIVATVKGYAIHEKDVLEKLTETRAKASQIVIDPSNCTQQQLNAFQTAQNEMKQALSRVYAIAENYPDLKANMNFQDLHAQLERSENDIAIARNNFTQTVCAYNVKIRRLPGSIIAIFLGFKKKAYFEAKEFTQNAPSVSF